MARGMRQREGGEAKGDLLEDLGSMQGAEKGQRRGWREEKKETLLDGRWAKRRS